MAFSTSKIPKTGLTTPYLDKRPRNEKNSPNFQEFFLLQKHLFFQENNFLQRHGNPLFQN